jgi:hypothetical protein
VRLHGAMVSLGVWVACFTQPGCPLFDRPNGLTLFSERLFAIPLNGTSVPASFTRYVPFPYLETGSGPDVHFDGPKMDEKGLAA